MTFVITALSYFLLRFHFYSMYIQSFQMILCCKSIIIFLFYSKTLKKKKLRVGVYRCQMWVFYSASTLSSIGSVNELSCHGVVWEVGFYSVSTLSSIGSVNELSCHGVVWEVGFYSASTLSSVGSVNELSCHGVVWEAGFYFANTLSDVGSVNELSCLGVVLELRLQVCILPDRLSLCMMDDLYILTAR